MSFCYLADYTGLMKKRLDGTKKEPICRYCGMPEVDHIQIVLSRDRRYVTCIYKESESGDKIGVFHREIKQNGVDKL